MLDPLADQHLALATEPTAVLFLGGRRFHHRTHSRITSLYASSARTIVSPPPGDSEVISHVDRLSSNETKIAPRSVRIAVGGRSATVCMVASRVGGSNLTLPKCRSLSTSPWDLEGEPAVGADLRHHRR